MSDKNYRASRQFDTNYKGCKGEVNTKPSETVPDQNISLRTLLINHSRGIPSQVKMREGQYYGVEIPDIQDLNDVAEYREALNEQKEDLQKQVRTESEEKARKKQDAADKARHKKLAEQLDLEDAIKQAKADEAD